MSRGPRPLPVPSGGFQHIAVLRLSSLGDVVLALPVVQSLAWAFPRARITFWTKEEYQDVVRFHPTVAHVRAVERDARRLEDMVAMGAELEDADLIVDLHGNLRTRVLTFRQRAPVLRAPRFRLRRAALVHARWARLEPPPSAIQRYALALAPLGLRAEEPPHLHVGDEAEAWAERWIAEWHPPSRPVAMLPAARHATKRWPQDHWLALHARLVEAGHALIYCSLAAEREQFPRLAERVDAHPRSRWVTEPLPRMAALLSRCRAAVSSDSGMMHVAAARGLRVVAMFGSTAPELGFAPAGDGHAVLCRHEPCQPCTLHGRESCPRGHFRCMTELEPDQVGEALAGILRRR